VWEALQSVAVDSRIEAEKNHLIMVLKIIVASCRLLPPILCMVGTEQSDQSENEETPERNGDRNTDDGSDS